MSSESLNSMRLRSLLTGALDRLHLRDSARRLRAAVQIERDKSRLRKAVHTNPLRIVVGSGGVVPDGWIKTDKEYLDLLDTRTWEQYFRERSIDAILAEH